MSGILSVFAHNPSSVGLLNHLPHVRIVIEAAQHRWGRTMTEERDRRLAEAEAAGESGDRRALRGHITRALASELADELEW